MEEAMPTQEVLFAEDTPPRLYTLEEAASNLVVREDDLNVLLPDTTIIADASLPRGIAPTDVQVLERFIRDIRKYSTGSV